MSQSALFVTYDGLLDPLGGSQILPYLRGISAHPRKLHVISFEKQDRFQEGATQLRDSLALDGISWSPLPFTARFGAAGKFWDFGRMCATAVVLQLRHRFAVVHCRSYQAMGVGWLLGRLSFAQTIFDMRGFWVDDRFDGGRWRLDSLVGRVLFKLMKRIEARLLQSASTIVVLTEAAAIEVPRLAPESTASIWVIPCCADYDHFHIPAVDERRKIRGEIGLPEDAFVISYLGSLGGLYRFEAMLRLFKAAANAEELARFFIITKDWSLKHEQEIDRLEMRHLRERIVVRGAARSEVPELLAVSDVMLCFYRPGFSRIGTSPTKLAEAFALGVPVICNSGIGDVDQIVDSLGAGRVIDLENPGAAESVANDLPRIRGMGGQELRERSRILFGLEVANDAYRRVYDSVANPA